MKKQGYICTRCGSIEKFGKAKGSMKMPYCQKCFRHEFDNDYKKYFMRHCPM